MPAGDFFPYFPNPLCPQCLCPRHSLVSNPLPPTPEQIREERRFQAAKAAMQALIAESSCSFAIIASDAVKYADALLLELEKKP